METGKNKGGRPRLETDKRSEHVVVRFTEMEDKTLTAMEAEFGMNRSELIRKRVLHDAEMIVVNSKALIKELDAVGAELGRAGNNINQLARHVNTFNRSGELPADIGEKFNNLLEQYIAVQTRLEISLRQIIRKLNR